MSMKPPSPHHIPVAASPPYPTVASNVHHTPAASKAEGNNYCPSRSEKIIERCFVVAAFLIATLGLVNTIAKDHQGAGNHETGVVEHNP